MKQYMPDRVFFEPGALEYPLGLKLYGYFGELGVPIMKTSVQNVSRNIPGSNEKEKYAASKKSLVVRAKKSLSFDICKPSADYEFPLVTNCPGSCEYCYLQTTQGAKPYLTVYVNIEDILESVKKHIEKNGNRLTTFEIASTGDPLALEHLTGSVARTVEFFGELENGRLRIVTKFDNADSLLSLRHNEHTRFRVSVNSRYVIKNFEHNTATFEERLSVASKISHAGYPTGFIIAPIMLYENWRHEYLELFDSLAQQVDTSSSGLPLTFELIQHRFTPVAKSFILQRFPNTKLDMDESIRAVKWGKYGRFKYVYPKEATEDIKNYISSLIRERFPDAEIEYFT